MARKGCPKKVLFLLLLGRRLVFCKKSFNSFPGSRRGRKAKIMSSSVENPAIGLRMLALIRALLDLCFPPGDTENPEKTRLSGLVMTGAQGGSERHPVVVELLQMALVLKNGTYDPEARAKLAATAVILFPLQKVARDAIEILKATDNGTLEKSALILRALAYLHSARRAKEVVTRLSPNLICRACAEDIPAEELPAQWLEKAGDYPHFLIHHLVDSDLKETLIGSIDPEADAAWLGVFWGQLHTHAVDGCTTASLLHGSDAARIVFAKKSNEELVRFFRDFSGPHLDAFLDIIEKMIKESQFSVPQLQALRAVMLGWEVNVAFGNRPRTSEVFRTLLVMDNGSWELLVLLYGSPGEAKMRRTRVGENLFLVEPVWARIARAANEELQDRIGAATYNYFINGQATLEYAIRVLPLCGRKWNEAIWKFLLEPSNWWKLGKAPELCLMELVEGTKALTSFMNTSVPLRNLVCPIVEGKWPSSIHWCLAKIFRRGASRVCAIAKEVSQGRFSVPLEGPPHRALF